MNIRYLFQKIYQIFHPRYEMNKEDPLRKKIEDSFSDFPNFYIKEIYYTKKGFGLSLYRKSYFNDKKENISTKSLERKLSA